MARGLRHKELRTLLGTVQSSRRSSLLGSLRFANGVTARAANSVGHREPMKTNRVAGDYVHSTRNHDSPSSGRRTLHRSGRKQAAQRRATPLEKPIRIVVVDDHRFMREVIAAMLRRQDSRYDVLAEAADGKSAIDVCRRVLPDLVLLDINLPDVSGIDLVPQIKKASPGTRVLLCTAYVTDDRIVDALRSGAEGFAEKTNTWSDFAEAVDRVLRGERYFCAHPSTALVETLPDLRKGLTPASTVGLSSREKEILTVIAQGATSKEIASKLGISVATVDTHRKHIMAKLHIRNVAGLVVFAFRAGLLKVQR
jgi:DNA-binding NarL/FixJ family response regulator